MTFHLVHYAVVNAFAVWWVRHIARWGITFTKRVKTITIIRMVTLTVRTLIANKNNNVSGNGQSLRNRLQKTSSGSTSFVFWLWFALSLISTNLYCNFKHSMISQTSQKVWNHPNVNQALHCVVRLRNPNNKRRSVSKTPLHMDEPFYHRRQNVKSLPTHMFSGCRRHEQSL